jgi:putative CocE/NonD family hydrolase
VQFGSRTSEFYRENIEFPFFSYFLKGRSDPRLPEAYVFETGRNQWRTLDAWPPAGVVRRSLYLAAGGRLSFDPPADTAGGYDEYVSDPAKPVPFTNSIAIGMTREHMVDDQRFVAHRADVLVYQTDDLQEDITIAGPIWPSLQVSTSGTDSDFIVKVIDVYPNDYQEPPGPAGAAGAPQGGYSRMGGYEQLLRGEVFRGKFRDGYDKPEPFEPNKVTKVEYVMPDVFHTFRRGHRIMVQIQSTWFPLVNLNPQKFMNILQATEGDFQKATERVYRGGRTGSKVDVGVLR